MSGIKIEPLGPGREYNSLTHQLIHEIYGNRRTMPIEDEPKIEFDFEGESLRDISHEMTLETPMNEALKRMMELTVNHNSKDTFTTFVDEHGVPDLKDDLRDFLENHRGKKIIFDSIPMHPGTALTLKTLQEYTELSEGIDAMGEHPMMEIISDIPPEGYMHPRGSANHSRDMANMLKAFEEFNMPVELPLTREERRKEARAKLREEKRARKQEFKQRERVKEVKPKNQIFGRSIAESSKEFVTRGASSEYYYEVE